MNDDAKLLIWMFNGDYGISSLTIASVMAGIETKNMHDPPHDPSDFRRCYELLKLFPEWRERLHEVAEKYPEWKPLVEAWDELTALYELESMNEDGEAPLLYDRLLELINEGRKRNEI